ncbi:hypothetical protein DENSPDRAFT_244525 [Dentipellis sp. KUC8613]|nr:hypothetical protein DENSPDRAFT_244525 [Dentipellis sp. KUC8613]
MATSGAAVPLQAIADRAEIHKSCRSLETVVNLLNDYCDSAKALSALQKKLSKALKDAAGLKATGDIPGNAFSAAASVFEVLSDVDAKYAKLVDKECDSVSNEVRKWFKKLAKEEKAHDDKINSTNTKIKQAGQLYEKKAKKNAYDAIEEHRRYMELLASLGPEISQEKYNHALAISQRNVTITYTVAGTLARVADAEWLRATENVRRSAPLIGSVGEWRALCEGGWAGGPPGDLDSDSQGGSTGPAQVLEDQCQEGLYVREGATERERAQGGSPAPPYYAPPAVTDRTRDSLSSSTGSNAPAPARRVNAPGPSPDNDAKAFPTISDRDERDYQSVSISTSLASFPSPPTHFPIPPVSGSGSKPSTPVSDSPMSIKRDLAPLYDSKGQRASATDASPSGSGHGVGNVLPKVDELPREEILAATRNGYDAPATPALTEGLRSPPTPRDYEAPPTPSTPAASGSVASSSGGKNRQRNGLGINADADDERDIPRTRERELAQATAANSLPPPPNTAPSAPNSRSSSYTAVTSNHGSGSFKKGDYLNDRDRDRDREFGVDRNGQERDKTKSLDSTQNKRVERSDTMRSSASGGSVVAAMRHKYSHSTGPPSQPPRDIPRLPLSVTDLANKYQTVATPTEPSAPDSANGTSPTSQRSRRAMSPGDKRRSYEFDSTAPRALPTTPSQSDELARRRQRIEQLEELERREEALEIRARERDFEIRTRERERMDTLRTRPAADGYASDAVRYAAPGQQQQQLQQPLSLASRHSHSTTSLPTAPAPAPSPLSPSTNALLKARRFPPPDLLQSQGHPISCTCPACTVARYSADPVPPPSQQRPVEKKGWRRRLSMPVIAFAGGDGKKEKAGPGMYGAGMGIAGGKGAGLERLGEANHSVANLGFARR